MADPADEDPNHQADQNDAELGAPVDQQSPSDPAAARPDEEGDPPAETGDDSPADADPLAIAQMESAPEAKPATKPPAPAAAKPEPTPPKPKPTQQPTAEKPSDTPAPADDAEIQEALADIPPEDWKNGVLSHKAKSQFLSQRKVIARLHQQVGASKKVQADLEAVEKLRQDQGLAPEEFVRSAIIEGAIKRGDPRAIPMLEQRLTALRKRAGVAETPPPAAPQPTPAAPPAPAIDPAALLAELEAATAAADDRLDFAQLNAVKAKLKALAGTPPAASPVQPPPAPQQQRLVTPPPAQPAAERPGPVAGEDVELQSIYDTLEGLGVADPAAHVRTVLMQQFPDLVQVPVGERLRAVVTKHREWESRRNLPARRPAGQPLSGRGGPVRSGGVTTNDPLKHAIRR